MWKWSFSSYNETANENQAEDGSCHWTGDKQECFFISWLALLFDKNVSQQNPIYKSLYGDKKVEKLMHGKLYGKTIVPNKEENARRVVIKAPR